MSLSFSTAKKLIEIKLKRNNLLIKLIDEKNKIIKLEMVMKLRLLQANQKKINDVKKINEIEKKQIDDYSLVRETEINFITDEINNSFIDIEDLKKDLYKSSEIINNLISEIEELNLQIPSKTVITNFKFPIKNTNISCRSALL